jgi:hypothetical protein
MAGAVVRVQRIRGVEAIKTYLDKVKPFLKVAVDYSDGRWSDKDLEIALLKGSQQLWVAIDGYVVGAATTQIMLYPSRKTLFIQFLGGNNFSNWGQEGIEAMSEYAKQQECDAIECFGRKGFLKVLGDYGFEPTYNVFEKKL